MKPSKLQSEEVPQSIDLPCIRVRQPIGEFYVASIDCKTLCKITSADVRRMLKERDFEKYLGVQRPLNPTRVAEISAYTNTIDACFPTAIILAIDARCAVYLENKGILRLSNFVDPDSFDEKVHFVQIAKVLDGQHRIAGLQDFAGENFEINISVFIDIDVAEQAYIFSTVNLAQTKVNKSLVYDLFDLARSRSPQKSCHNIAVALDSKKDSPFFQRIKRLGIATEGRFNETLTQATFVESLLPYITNDKHLDRDTLMRGKSLKKASASELQKLPFRNFFVEERDAAIADILWNYFGAARNRWPRAWSYLGSGSMLNKTNGFRALMRFLRPAYLDVAELADSVPTSKTFEKILSRVTLTDDDFNVERFKPGSSGEALLYQTLIAETNIRSN